MSASFQNYSQQEINIIGNFYTARNSGRKLSNSREFRRKFLTCRIPGNLREFSDLGGLAFHSLQIPTDLRHLTPCPKGTPKFSRNKSGVGTIVAFRHLSCRISDTVQDRVQVAIPAKIWGVPFGVDESCSSYIGVCTLQRDFNLYDHNTSTPQTDGRTDNLPWQYRALCSIARK